MKILAVDDDELTLELLSESLSANGYNDLVTASSAKNALDLISALDSDHDGIPGAFDVILLDIQMPGMNGVDLCGKIRALSKYKKTPILMLTSLSDRGSIDGAFSQGATDYISKPFDAIELGARIGMAKTLVTEQRKTLEAFFTTSNLAHGAEQTSQMAFDMPVLIEDVPGSSTIWFWKTTYCSFLEKGSTNHMQ